MPTTVIPAKPANEQQRLQALRSYGLDQAYEASFNTLAKLAAETLKVPYALISIISENRQWFKACYGIDV